MEQRIIAAIERLSYVFRILLWDLAKRERLSPIQIQFLIYLNSHSERLCRVSQLAREFGLTKATVSDAIKSLQEKRFICKNVLQYDKRIFTLKLTLAGKRLVKKLTNWADSILYQLKKFSPQVKESVMVFLMELIESLQMAGLISVIRMCISCRNFLKNAYPDSSKPHYCRLTQKRIADSELKIDCQSYRERYLFWDSTILN